MDRRLDLNLLRYLFAINQYRDATTITRRLGISRSTLTRSLAQLRGHFDNEVFVLVNGEYKPTVFTKRLLEQLSGPMAVVDDVLGMSNCEQLEQMEGNLRLYSPAYIGDLLAVGVINGIKQCNPNMGLSIYPWPVDQLPALNSSEFSIGINRFPMAIDGDFIQRRLNGAEVGVYFRADHLFAKQSIVELSQLKCSELITLETGAYVDSFDEVRNNRSGINFNSQIVMSTMSSALRCAAAFNYFVVAANLYGRGHDELTWRPLRIEGEPTSYECGLVYHRTWYQHPAMRQVESIVSDAFRNIQARRK